MLGVADQEVPAQGQVLLTQIQEARRWLQVRSSSFFLVIILFLTWVPVWSPLR